MIQPARKRACRPTRDPSGVAMPSVYRIRVTEEELEAFKSLSADEVRRVVLKRARDVARAKKREGE